MNTILAEESKYYFGEGIQHSPAGTTPYGTPIRVIDLGVTHVPKDVFEMYFQEISPRYTAETYSLLTHNCNNFSNENLETTLRAGVVPQVPQFRPSVSTKSSQSTNISVNGSSISSQPKEVDNKVKDGEQPKYKEVKTSEKTIPPSKPTGTQEKSKNNGAAADPLRDARAKVQEEITREFAAIMTSGILRASEAAALATRKDID
ncbi:deSI-like protein [Gossypium australe]|uniref:DeSI-like protein n=1 Tax=Gossypium australe TaxID=47621 RepID=A0A5B6WDE7_9ROSI|nr:deSI-like protein [Gossypium australe]